MIAIPPKPPSSSRSDEEHEAIYRLFIIEGRSGEITAGLLNKRFPGADYTRFSVGSYSHRCGWVKAGRSDAHGRIPPPESAASKRSKFAPGPNSAVLADLDPRSPDGALLLDFSQCHWPVGASPRGAMERQLFCGDEAHSGPYCTVHTQAAYPGSTGSKDKADAAED